MADELEDYRIMSNTTWSAKCPKCTAVMFRASEEAIRKACVGHPCPPPLYTRPVPAMRKETA